MHTHGNYMTKYVNVLLKGVEWIVGEDLSISANITKSEYIRFRNGKQQNVSHTRRIKPLSQCKTKNGYVEVATTLDGKRVKCLVHRLIGMAFVSGYNEELKINNINHINGIKTDNRPENLEWVTNEGNVKHAWRTGLVDLKGENHPDHKLTQKQVILIRKLLRETTINTNQIALLCGVSTSIIDLIKQNKRWVNVN